MLTPVSVRSDVCPPNQEIPYTTAITFCCVAFRTTSFVSDILFFASSSLAIPITICSAYSLHLPHPRNLIPQLHIPVSLSLHCSDFQDLFDHAAAPHSTAFPSSAGPVSPATNICTEPTSSYKTPHLIHTHTLYTRLFNLAVRASAPSLNCKTHHHKTVCLPEPGNTTFDR